MIRIALPALMLGLGLASIQPADSHCYSVWRYNTPQHCHAGGVYARAEAAPKLWYVEILKPPPAPSAPLEADQRTKEQIQDFTEHQIALAKHHDEINALMILLHAQEEAHKAAGLAWPPD